MAGGGMREFMPREIRLVSIATGAWGLAYGLYRGYYALGGTGWLPGVPADPAQFRLVNGVGAVILLLAAATPLALLPLWARPRARVLGLAVCWLVAVGCVMHGLVDIGQRVLSLTGHLRIDYPRWTSINSRTADLQDLFFNEPWFIVEGLGFGLIGWLVLGRPRPRRWWVGSGLVAVAILTVVGLLSALDVIGSFILG